MSGQPSKKSDLVKDLIYLRQGRGLTPDRIFAAATLAEVCGDEQPPDMTHGRLVSAIQSLPEQQSRDALLAAYGLLPLTRSLLPLKARREAYGKQIERKSDTVAAREDVAIKELALRLLASYYAGAPLPAQLPPVPHGGYLIDYLNVTTVYRDRRFLEHQQERRIISLVDGAPGFRYHSSDTDSSGRTRLLAVEGCTVETEYVPGGSLHMLRFPTPLKYGDVHDVGGPRDSRGDASQRFRRAVVRDAGTCLSARGHVSGGQATSHLGLRQAVQGRTTRQSQEQRAAPFREQRHARQGVPPALRRTVLWHCVEVDRL